MASKGLKVHVVIGADATDEIFAITLKSGEHVVWNVTRLNAAARRGEFGPIRFAAVADLPAADWSTWGAEDRATVEYIKTDAHVLSEPAIAIASPIPEFAMNCFADGQHRLTARQELGLPEFSFYLVPVEVERRFRVTGLNPEEWR